MRIQMRLILGFVLILSVGVLFQNCAKTGDGAVSVETAAATPAPAIPIICSGTQPSNNESCANVLGSSFSGIVFNYYTVTCNDQNMWSQNENVASSGSLGPDYQCSCSDSTKTFNSSTKTCEVPENTPPSSDLCSKTYSSSFSTAYSVANSTLCFSQAATGTILDTSDSTGPKKLIFQSDFSGSGYVTYYGRHDLADIKFNTSINSVGILELFGNEALITLVNGAQINVIRNSLADKTNFLFSDIANTDATKLVGISNLSSALRARNKVVYSYNRNPSICRGSNMPSFCSTTVSGNDVVYLTNDLVNVNTPSVVGLAQGDDTYVLHSDFGTERGAVATTTIISDVEGSNIIHIIPNPRFTPTYRCIGDATEIVLGPATYQVLGTDHFRFKIGSDNTSLTLDAFKARVGCEPRF